METNLIKRLTIKIQEENNITQAQKTMSVYLKCLGVVCCNKIAKNHYFELLDMLKQGNSDKEIKEFCEKLDKKIHIDDFIENLQTFIKKYNKYPSYSAKPRSDYSEIDVAEEVRLAAKVNVFRQLKKKEDPKLTQEMIEKLDGVGFIWSCSFDVDKFIEKLQIFVKENGRYPRKDSLNKEESKFGHQVANVRQAKKRKRNLNLTEEMIDKLNKANFIWDEDKKFNIDKFIEDLQSFINQNGYYPKWTSKNPTEHKLAIKVYHVRQAKKGFDNLKLTQDMIEKLEEINFNWEVNKNQKIELFISKLQKFIKENGRYPSTKTADEEERKLATQVHHFRQAKRGTGELRLSESVERILNESGFIWVSVVDGKRVDKNLKTD